VCRTCLHPKVEWCTVRPHCFHMPQQHHDSWAAAAAQYVHNLQKNEQISKTNCSKMLSLEPIVSNRPPSWVNYCAWSIAWVLKSDPEMMKPWNIQAERSIGKPIRNPNGSPTPWGNLGVQPVICCWEQLQDSFQWKTSGWRDPNILNREAYLSTTSTP
jgi:hypothetical protein